MSYLLISSRMGPLPGLFRVVLAAVITYISPCMHPILLVLVVVVTVVVSLDGVLPLGSSGT